MKYKVTTLTPVHIKSGNINPFYIYGKSKRIVARYKLEDILENAYKQMPLSAFLKRLPDDLDHQKKTDFLNVFREYVCYAELAPLYELQGDNQSLSKDISEQMKSLSRPYIPGSTLKGAFLNAVWFYLMKNKLAEAISYIDTKKIKEDEKSAREMLNKLYEKEFKEFKRFKQFEELKAFDEVMKYYSRCLICRDIYFDADAMILCHAKRLHMEKDNTVLFDMECIKHQQSVTGEFFMLDETEIKLFQDRFLNLVSIFQPLFKIDFLFELLREMYELNSQEDVAYFRKHAFDILRNRFVSYPTTSTKEECILRIGNSTNYFYKSISLLIKNKCPEIYERNFQLFSPVNIKKSKRAPKSQTMPKTRTVFHFDGQYYLPGILKIEKCK